MLEMMAQHGGQGFAPDFAIVREVMFYFVMAICALAALIVIWKA
jgi:hypothetical protein